MTQTDRQTDRLTIAPAHDCAMRRCDKCHEYLVIVDDDDVFKAIHVAIHAVINDW